MLRWGEISFKKHKILSSNISVLPGRYGYGGAGTVPALMTAAPGQHEETKPL